MGYYIGRIGTVARPQIGDVRISFTMQPCATNGQAINGGNHYANADTIERAREWANTILAKETHLGYAVASVRITGEAYRLGVSAWAPIGGAYVNETVTR